MERAALCLSDVDYMWSGLYDFIKDLPKTALTLDEKEAVGFLIFRAYLQWEAASIQTTFVVSQVLVKHKFLKDKHYTATWALAVQGDPRRFDEHGNPCIMSAKYEADARAEFELRVEQKRVRLRTL
jgi:hypothetical protein